MHSVFTESTPDLKPSGRLSGRLGGPAPAETWDPQPQSGWLAENPLGVPTEREVHALEQGITIHRFMLQKQNLHDPD